MKFVAFKDFNKIGEIVSNEAKESRVQKIKS